MEDFRQKMMSMIRSNVERHGHHIYTIQGGESPRYFYTIGLKDDVGAELVFAGMAQMSVADAANLVDTMAKTLRAGAAPEGCRIEKGRYGIFGLAEAHHSWTKRMLLGAYDYYDCAELRAWQIRTVESTAPIDVPDMRVEFDPHSDEHRVWKWLDGNWPYKVPSSTMVVTNDEVLDGFGITELMRWEEDEWEMFSGAGPDVPDDQVVILPLATLLAFDPSLEPALSVPVGTGLFREFNDDGIGPWQVWKSQEP